MKQCTLICSILCQDKPLAAEVNDKALGLKRWERGEHTLVCLFFVKEHTLVNT